MLIDSHAHLQWPDFDKDRGAVVSRARRAGVKQIINVGYDLEGSEDAVVLAEKYGLYASVGIHPHEAESFSDESLERLKELCENPKVIGVGEVGLDYYRSPSSRVAQLNAFLTQIELAKELDKPVIIHDRAAHGDILAALKRNEGEVRGVMHCFSGSFEMAKQCVKLGFFISFAGPVTFPNARRLHKLAKELPLDYILIETDSPWLAPQSRRGKRNEPAFIVEVANKIAELRKESLGRIAEETSSNARKLFEI